MSSMSAKDFIISEKIGPDSTDRDEYIDKLQKEMSLGIAKEKSSLAMIPTYVSCKNTLSVGDKAIAVDFGGTNFRVALVSVENSGVCMENFETCPAPGKDRPLEWNEFIDFMADKIRPFTAYTNKVGICISFPTTITPDGDGIVHYFTKEIDIRGYEDRRIGNDIKEALGLPELSVKIVNDTTAVLLSALSYGVNAEGILGLIEGTGVNLCCQIDKSKLGIAGNGKMVVAMETGGFVSPDCADLDRKLDSHTIAPGVYLEEKKVAGGYLGKLCTLALKKAADENLFSRETADALKESEEYSTPDMDDFGYGLIGVNAFSCREDMEKGREIVEAIFSRAAKHIALSICGTIEKTVPEGTDVTLSADGSVFRKSAVFRREFSKYMKEFCADRNINYAEIEDSTIIGTAIGALI